MCREKAGGQDEMRMLRAMYAEGEERLRQAGIEEAGLDAWYLLEFVTGVDKAHYYMEPDRRMEQSVAQEYEKVVNLRAEHIPLQHITGVQEFMGLGFRVSGDVLIPRQDTEVLVEEALKYVHSGMKLLDMCTGSGCIAISLAVMGGYRDVTAADLSEAALKVAAENADHLLQERRKEGCRFTLRRGDLFEALKPGERFDVLTSNPPYIPTEVVRGLEPEVKDHEPWMALDGTEDGLAFYRRIAHESKAWLNPGACIYLEIGYDQGKAVSRLLEAAGFCNIQVIKDLPGLDRVVRAEIKK